ncbi:FliI/YscN family ATPase [Nereida sp. MMG025]|uniref:FliI/YscN family ATPase n=1 Tax=Nereida sp. MMG025 TaxID=2909981 RepID=UPI001F0121ED|nr:FliI/YscN family ATPase [Nereida sp. MMG025]MCF6444686.1 FliI/YscN family ATPase [Nereida sp. MMG025]
MTDPFLALRDKIRTISPVRIVGRVQRITDSVIEVSGLQHIAQLGDVVCIQSGKKTLEGEVLDVTRDAVLICPEDRPQQLRLNDLVQLIGPRKIAPSLSWIGRVVDANGQPIDGLGALSLGTARSIVAEPPSAVARRSFGAQLSTPYCVMNTFLPLARGQRVGLFAGSGVGKSTLLAGLACGVQADVNVIALIGERGREVNEFISDVLGPDGLAKSIVVVATSDQSAALRKRAAHTAMTIAEMLRDEGRNVLFLADSLTRFAEAHRQIALSAGEPAGPDGFPPSTAGHIMQLCERAGPGAGYQGDITAVFSVLVAGSDMDGPIADITRGVLDGHIVLERKIAERGRFPAIDLSRSVSRSVQHVLDQPQRDMLNYVRGLLGHYESSEVMIRAGLYSPGSDPLLDKAVRVWPDLDAFIGRADGQDIQGCFDDLAKVSEKGSTSLPAD